eukprot:CAMPEP_0197457920 /NCGR_PEP_ID=MMETSP1175-20131217/47381_1 /TAXON_ID=1003142 /ORGANISM="Triceratium dubium, Strain CCMP147" /LENGTH=219 /DNA_ID=CAMNT_0042992417 /DNA_START=112 /DNA_END=771 /DNA_ORIENTATION=-
MTLPNSYSKRFASFAIVAMAMMMAVSAMPVAFASNPPKVDVSEYSVMATIVNTLRPNGPGSPSNATVGPGLLAYSETLRATVQGNPEAGQVQLTFQNSSGVFTYTTFGPPGFCQVQRQPDGLNFLNMNPQSWFSLLNFIGIREKGGKVLSYYNFFVSRASVYELWTVRNPKTGQEEPVYAAISANVPLVYSVVEYTFNSVAYGPPPASYFKIPAACAGM